MISSLWTWVSGNTISHWLVEEIGSSKCMKTTDPPLGLTIRCLTSGQSWLRIKLDRIKSEMVTITTFGAELQEINALLTCSTDAKESPTETTTSTQSWVPKSLPLKVSNSSTEELRWRPNFQRVTGFGLPSGSSQDTTSTETGQPVARSISWKAEEMLDTQLQLEEDLNLSVQLCIGALTGLPTNTTRLTLSTLNHQGPWLTNSTFTVFIGTTRLFTLTLTTTPTRFFKLTTLPNHIGKSLELPTEKTHGDSQATRTLLSTLSSTWSLTWQLVELQDTSQTELMLSHGLTTLKELHQSSTTTRELGSTLGDLRALSKLIASMFGIWPERLKARKKSSQWICLTEKKSKNNDPMIQLP